jgi:C-terminal processing protease CtpA/Prc
VFLRRGIPALHLFSGVHTDYHKPSDDSERFEAEGAARVAALAEDLEQRLASAGDLPFVEPAVDPQAGPAMRERSWSVWFGSVPAYGAEVDGFKLAGTSAGSPAEKAGLLKDDVITQIGDIEIHGMPDFLYMLQVYKPGDVVLTRFLRDGQPHEVRMTLATRAAE